MSIVQTLITPIDNIRSKMAEIVGHRPYNVRVIWTEWSGGTRGIGTETVVRTVTFDPPPALSGDEDRKLAISGLQEAGTLDVSEISLSISEETLTGGVLGEQQDFYWEVDFGKTGTWRRYVPASKPEQDIEGSFGWRLAIRRCEGCQTS